MALVVTEHLARLLEVNLPHDWVPRRSELRPVLTKLQLFSIPFQVLLSHTLLQSPPLTFCCGK